MALIVKRLVFRELRIPHDKSRVLMRGRSSALTAPLRNPSLTRCGLQALLRVSSDEL